MTTIGRRDFLTTGAGLLIVGLRGRVAGQQDAASLPALTPGPQGTALNPAEIDSWLTLPADGKVVFHSGRMDMGTGVQTAFAQVLADELDVRLEDVEVMFGDTNRSPDQGKSTASSNMSRGLQPLRVAAAEARLVLLTLAAGRLATPLANLTVQDGVVMVQGDPGRQVTYGALIAGRRFERQVNVTWPTTNSLNWDAPRRAGWGPVLQGTAPLKTRDFRYSGRSIPRRDVPAKVTGTFTYVHTVRVPGMVHGRVVLPPTIGSTLGSVDEGSVRNVPGLIRIVRRNNYLAVVAEREDQAVAAAARLKAEWRAPTLAMPSSADIGGWLRQARQIRTATQARGDVDAAFAGASRILRASYEWPVQNHAMMGPSCAVADVRPNQVTVWSGSQWEQQTRRDLAQFLGVSPDIVRVILTPAAGSYGRTSCDDAAADAAFLSKEVGRPVRVLWSRQDEHAWEPSSPPMAFDLRAALDKAGDVVAFDLEGWSPTHSTAEVGNFLAWRLIGGHPGWDQLTGFNANHPYQFESNRIAGHYVEELLRSIYLRAPGGVQTSFAIESFIDELAAAAAADPLEFRLRYLSDPEILPLVRAVADRAQWRPRAENARQRPNTGVVSGRGICVNARAVAVADVDVNLDTGGIRVTKVTIGAVCGRIINPDGIRHQVQGALLQGLSRTLYEEVTFEKGRVTSRDWRSYPIMRFPDVPEVDTLLLDQPDRDMLGLGELATSPAPAAIGNAVFDATGVRLRRVPFTPARVREALARTARSESAAPVR